MGPLECMVPNFSRSAAVHVLAKAAKATELQTQYSGI